MTALPSRRDELVSLFLEADVLGRAAAEDGFIGAELLLADPTGSPVVVVARWRDEAAYAAWRANPIREEVSTTFVSLIESETSEVLRVAATAAR
ncbi:MAG: antibiotic biosynthesis monooxygenase [Actinobacteria bacterium]|nr:antibiotic biosynthesis monooxygenase [Actinomycetota bacterium]